MVKKSLFVSYDGITRIRCCGYNLSRNRQVCSTPSVTNHAAKLMIIFHPFIKLFQKKLGHTHAAVFAISILCCIFAAR